jgi:hypothetical protein
MPVALRLRQHAVAIENQCLQPICHMP